MKINENRVHTEESESCQPPHTMHTVFACLNADACLFVFAGVHHIMPDLTGQCLNAAGVGWLRRAFCGESFGNMRLEKTFRTLREDFLGRLFWENSVGQLFGEHFLGHYRTPRYTCIPDICHFFSTDTIFGKNFLHTIARKLQQTDFVKKTA